jgi:hypothetical protein
MTSTNKQSNIIDTKSELSELIKLKIEKALKIEEKQQNRKSKE